METTKRYRATRLGEVIEQQGRFRQWVAEQARVHPSLISHVIAGRRTVTEDVAERISRSLGVPLFLIFELSCGSIELPDRQVEAVPA